MSIATEVRLAPALERDADQVFQFLLDNFFVDEPMNSYLKRMPKKETFMPLKRLREGHSFVAYATSQDGQEVMAGVVINGVERRGGEGKKRPEEADTLKIYNILQVLEKKADVWSRIPSDVLFSTIILTVSRKHRGLSLGRRLMEASLTRAAECGCRHATVECSSYYSARLVEAMGYEWVCEVRYEDHTDENGDVVFRVSKPHERLVKFLKTL